MLRERVLTLCLCVNRHYDNGAYVFRTVQNRGAHAFLVHQKIMAFGAQQPPEIYCLSSTLEILNCEKVSSKRNTQSLMNFPVSLFRPRLPRSIPRAPCPRGCRLCQSEVGCRRPGALASALAAFSLGEHRACLVSSQPPTTVVKTGDVEINEYFHMAGLPPTPEGREHAPPHRQLLHKVHLPFRGPWPRSSHRATKPGCGSKRTVNR